MVKEPPTLFDLPPDPGDDDERRREQRRLEFANGLPPERLSNFTDTSRAAAALMAGRHRKRLNWRIYSHMKHQVGPRGATQEEICDALGLHPPTACACIHSLWHAYLLLKVAGLYRISRHKVPVQVYVHRDQLAGRRFLPYTSNSWKKRYDALARGARQLGVNPLEAEALGDG